MLPTRLTLVLLCLIADPTWGQNAGDSPLRRGHPASAVPSAGEPRLQRTIGVAHNFDGPHSHRKTVELSTAVSAALRAESLAEVGEPHLESMRQLSTLYDELEAHQRFAKSQLLQRQHRRIFVRMVRAYDTVRRIPTDQPQDGSTETPKAVGTATIGSDQTVLAQFVGAGGAAGANGVGGGPGSAARGNDYSDELIDIITRTIRPESWTRLGGPSSIAYYRQGMALILRAPQEVHDEVARLLGDLRAASGP